MIHTPVLSNEILEVLNPKSGDIIIDATANGGGHTLQIAEHIIPNGRIFALDTDKEIIKLLKERVETTKCKKNITISHQNFSKLQDFANQYRITGKINGILFDLGLSSWHIQNSGRGFSFKKNEPIDMRFSTNNSLTAEKIINTYPQDRLEKILKLYGQERFAKRIAKKIVTSRKIKRIFKTFDLIDILREVLPKRTRATSPIHFATRTFQALRIETNNELEILYQGLNEAFAILAPKGKLVVITYHSLEDRVVKILFRDHIKNKKAISLISMLQPTKKEIRRNRRARSAKLRAIQKI